MRYRPGRKAVMTIYDDAIDENENENNNNDAGKEENSNKKRFVVEEVPLHEITSRQALHALMTDKGFRLKPADEVARIRAEHRAREAERRRNPPKPPQWAYALVVVVLLLFGGSCLYCCYRIRLFWRKRRRRQPQNKEDGSKAAKQD